MIEIYFPEFPQPVIHSDTLYERIKSDYLFPTTLVAKYQY